MIRQPDILCISSIDWDFIWQGHQEIMSTLATQGHRVLFLENTGVRSPQRPRYPARASTHPQLVEGHQGVPRGETKPVRLFADRAAACRIRGWRAGSTARCCSDRCGAGCARSASSVRSSGRFCRRRSRSISSAISIPSSRCTTASTTSPRARSARGGSSRARRRCFATADLVFVTSEKLRQRAAMHSDHVHLFPFGVKFDAFDRIREDAAAPPADVAQLRRPVVGYVGGLHQWVDQDLVAAVAARLPEFSIALVGPEQSDLSTLRSAPNIVLLGLKPHSELPRYVKAFDVGLVPYRLYGLHRQCLPDQAERVPGDGHPGGRDRPAGDPPIQRRARRRGDDRRRRRRVCSSHQAIHRAFERRHDCPAHRGCGVEQLAKPHREDEGADRRGPRPPPGGQCRLGADAAAPVSADPKPGRERDARHCGRVPAVVPYESPVVGRRAAQRLSPAAAS